MTDRLLLDSFIVRIYRSDEDDFRKMTGIVEALDGSGEIEPFLGVDELSEIIIRRTNGIKKGLEKYYKKRNKINTYVDKVQVFPVS